jgi:hypothetical protein
VIRGENGALPGPAMGKFTALADLGSGIGPMIMGVILNGPAIRQFFCLVLSESSISLFYYAIAKEKKRQSNNDEEAMILRLGDQRPEVKIS